MEAHAGTGPAGPRHGTAGGHGGPEGRALKLLVINPNTTHAMTDGVVAQVRALAGPATEVRGVTARTGYAVIDSRPSFAAGAQAALEAWQRCAGWADAAILACFGDPGLAALRQAAPVPVIGLAQAALREAMAARQPYRIVTAGAAWPEMLRDNVRAEDASAQLESIVALDTTGLVIARDPGAFLGRVQDALDHARNAGVRTVILGGAGFAGMKARLQFDGLLIDGVEAATRAVLGLLHRTAAFAGSRSP